MKIFIGTDHAGFDMKQKLVSYLDELGYDVKDMGAYELDKEDDYPDFITPTAQAVSENPKMKGIILGGSGQGEAIVANHVSGIRAVVYYGGPLDIIRLSREHNDANILSLGARFITVDEACDAVRLWLETEFSGEERHKRRLRKIDSSSSAVFDNWNDLKKYSDGLNSHSFFKERDVFYVKIGKNIGCEQNGKNKDFGRPVLILKKFNNDIFWGIPLSRTKNIGKYYFSVEFVQGEKSTAILSQIRLFDGRRLLNKRGMISKDDFSVIKQKIRNILFS